jgi:predicted Fe-Mo cluster-binding NifX family protein
MKIVIPYSKGRISPVFDVAEHFYLIEIKHGKEFSRQNLSFGGNRIFFKAQILSELKVDMIICGAISEIQENVLKNTGIQLLSFICGDVEKVLKAFLEGSLQVEAFKMPGYCGKHHRRRFRGGRYKYN